MRKVFFFLFTIVLIGCNEKPASNKRIELNNGKNDFEKVLIESHQEFLKKEKQRISEFTDSLKLTFKKTGTGLQYYIYKKTTGDSIATGEVAVISYRLQSLTGELFYESPKGKLQEFMVDYDNVESGLHEGIQLLKVGEKAYFILPAHLGHGITGDQAAITSQVTLFYDVHLVAKM